MTSENEKPVSPLPWDIDGRDYFKVLDANDVTILGAWHPKPLTDETANHAMADIAYIVTACNAYPDLKARIVALETENRGLRENLTRARAAWVVAKADIRFIADGGNSATSAEALCEAYERKARQIVAEIESALQGDQNVTGT